MKNMKKKILFFVGFIGFFSMLGFSQIKLGIRAGVNMANAITDYSLVGLQGAFKSENLTGLTIGPTLQIMIPKVNLGIETAALFSQKGFNFSDSIKNIQDATNILVEGYNSSNYFEVPFNLKWRFGIDWLNAYVAAGPYFGFPLSTEVVLNTVITSISQNASINKDFFKDMETGINVGIGAELFKTLQLGINYSYGFKKSTQTEIVNAVISGSPYTYTPGDFQLSNSVFSVLLTYYF
jgi:hypothetical protein